MSERFRNLRAARNHRDPRNQRDEGMTLPELLIGIVMVGIIIASLSSAVIVILNQQDNTSGRLNNARSEQGVGLWMPADLASAQTVDTSPNANPCSPSTCPPSGIVAGGSNALMLGWTSLEPNSSGTGSVVKTTRVSYQYAKVGDEYQLIRVHCSSTAGGAWTCDQTVVLHNLDAPPSGLVWEPGTTAPDWVIKVSQPLDPADTGTESTVPVDPGLNVKNARRVVVTINGGGDAAGAGGGTNQISLSAGGANRQDLDKTSLTGTPTFTAARTRCGGNLALIIDESSSIGSTAIGQVKAAISNFITLFAGTPVQLQLVRFDSKSSILGDSGWSRYFNMLNESDVATLTGAVSQLRSNGGTNWEDAWYRTFFNNDGTVQSVIPDLVVFFTDGVPTYSRLNQSSSTGPTTPPDLEGYQLATGSSFNQEAFDRADYIARQFRSSVRFIGVGVGPDLSANSTWYNSVPAYERGYHLGYERLGQWYERSDKFLFQRSNKLLYQRSDKLIYEQLVGSTWTTRTVAQYNTGNTVSGEADGWRTRVGSGTATWTTVATTKAQYDSSNTVAGTADGWRTSPSSTSGVTWTSVAQSEYELSNTTAGSDATDGWRTSYSSSGETWLPATAAAYGVYNTTGTSSDGWRVSGTAGTWSTTTQALYTAGNTTADESDGWRTTKIYSSPYDLWEATTVAIYNSTTSSGRRSNDAAVTVSTPNSTIITRLITGSDFGVPAISSGGVYTNTKEANLYMLPNWSEFAGALAAVALNECGGTLTLQTKVGGVAAADPFTYQNTALTNSAGQPVTSSLTVVTTTRQFASGTFDFNVANGSYLTVEIQPQNLSDLVGYQPAGWTCKAGITARAVTPVPITGSPWSGIKVRVGANEAVSCVQNVTRG